MRRQRVSWCIEGAWSGEAQRERLFLRRNCAGVHGRRAGAHGQWAGERVCHAGAHERRAHGRNVDGRAWVVVSHLYMYYK